MRLIGVGFRLILEKYVVVFSMVYDGSTFSSNEIYEKGNQKEEKSVLFSISYMGMKTKHKNWLGCFINIRPTNQRLVV